MGVRISQLRLNGGNGEALDYAHWESEAMRYAVLYKCGRVAVRCSGGVNTATAATADDDDDDDDDASHSDVIIPRSQHLLLIDLGSCVPTWTSRLPF